MTWGEWAETFSKPSNLVACVTTAISVIAAIAAVSQSRSAKKAVAIAEQNVTPVIDQVYGVKSSWDNCTEVHFIIKNQLIVRLKIERIRCRTFGYKIVKWSDANVTDEGTRSVTVAVLPAGRKVVSLNTEARGRKEQPYGVARIRLLVTGPTTVCQRLGAKIWSITHRTDDVVLDVETKSTMDAMKYKALEARFHPETKALTPPPANAPKSKTRWSERGSIWSNHY